MDQLIDKKDLETWADLILNKSLGGITPDDIVMVKGEYITWPLLSVLQDKIFKAGAIADMNLVAPDNNRGMVFGASICRHGTTEQIKRTPEWHHLRYEKMTKYIEVLGAEKPELFSGLPNDTSQALFIADGPFKTIRLSKKWVITLYPTQAFADIEGMDLKAYTDVIVNASTTDPSVLEEAEKPIARLISQSDDIKIVTEHPDTNKILTLTMDISEREPVMCVGERNFPDGEVFTSPNAERVHGEIYVDLPVYYNGETIQGIYLKIDNGIISEYESKLGNSTFKKIVETDEGSRRIGEVALGMNKGITTALKHPLFVEKVGGTAHIAIGASYKDPYHPEPESETGQKIIEELFQKGQFNKSAQHVDIVVDFRDGGSGRELYIGGVKLEIRDGGWSIPE